MTSSDPNLLKYNSLNLKFFEPNWEEGYVLRDIECSYRPDTWGLTPENVLLEIGSHTGGVAIFCAKKYGCEVFTFEPSPRNHEKLLKNIALNDVGELIHVTNAAVTKDGRNVRISMPKNGGGHNVYGRDTDPLVNSLTLHSIVENIRANGKTIQIILMDCEGAEFELIEDAECLRGIPLLRGEFHSHKPHDIETLLEKFKTIIPDSDPYMHFPPNVRLSREQVFSLIYEKNSWGSSESKSGRGSEIKHTQDIQHWLPRLIRDLEVTSILDAGCGDFNWMRYITLDIPYYGYDIVPKMIERNRTLYGTKLRTFFVADITETPLNKADLVICRDVLFHLSYDGIRKALMNMMANGTRYLLITNCSGKSENRDVYDGSYRRIDFHKFPFSFPPPLASFLDCTIANEIMLLYEAKTISKILMKGI